MTGFIHLLVTRQSISEVKTVFPEKCVRFSYNLTADVFGFSGREVLQAYLPFRPMGHSQDILKDVHLTKLTDVPFSMPFFSEIGFSLRACGDQTLGDASCSWLPLFHFVPSCHPLVRARPKVQKFLSISSISAPRLQGARMRRLR